MSQFNSKGKKYSWLPEATPAAVSGENNSSASSNQNITPTEQKGPAQTTPTKKSAKESTSKTPNDSVDADGLGISTSNPVILEAPPSKGRRRKRKDSVDELVRSRFFSSHTTNGKGRQTSDNDNVTASVRESLAAESFLPPLNGSRRSNGRFNHHNQQYVDNSHVKLGRVRSKYSFPSCTALSTRSVISRMARGTHGVGDPNDYLGHGLEVTTGENVIVIHPGSRWLNIGRASDAVPKSIPHVIARRWLNGKPPNKSEADSGAAETVDAATADDNQMENNDSDGTSPEEEEEVDDDDDGSNSEGSESIQIVGSHPAAAIDLTDQPDSVDDTLTMLRNALKEHQWISKRKVPPNVYSQVLSYNRQTKPEIIQDHNDPFKVEWISDSEIDETYVVGEKALRLADTESFAVRYPIRNGYFNVEDYESIEEVTGDIETIWTCAIEDELGIKRKDLSEYGVVLAIPDLFSRQEVLALSHMLLRHLGFHYLLIQQSSALVTFGAGFSSACVVDVGAQKTSIACVEDGYCYQESRVNVMYGGDDITRSLYDLFVRSKFPYQEAKLNRIYDWGMLNELRERLCTMKLSDVNIRLQNFYVRQPNNHNTLKYSFKIYDEVYQAPLCLFYPNIVQAQHRIPQYSDTFVCGLVPDMPGDTKSSSSLATTAITPTQFGLLPAKAVVEDTEIVEVKEIATAAAAAATEPGTPDPRTNDNDNVKPTNGNSQTLPTTPVAAAATTNPIRYVPDHDAQFSRMPLDLAVTHSIAHAGTLDKAKKLYTSILVIGGGVAYIPGFNDLLSSRLMHIRPSYLQGIVENVDIVSAPRDLDPRQLAWKGGAVLSRLECARGMWISQQEWSDFGPKLLRDRVLFPW